MNKHTLYIKLKMPKDEHLKRTKNFTILLVTRQNIRIHIYIWQFFAATMISPIGDKIYGIKTY